MVCPRRRLAAVAIAASAVIGLPAAAAGQCVSARGDSAVRAPLVVVGSLVDDARRIAQDLGQCSTDGAMMRSAATLSASLPGSGWRWAAVMPSLRETWNSDIPWSSNDGPVWAGRGLNTVVQAGIRAEDGPLSIGFAPQLVHEANRDFFVFPDTVGGRSPFSSPWHNGIESADLPLRFGDAPITAFNPGDSWIEGRFSNVVVGASTDDQWWGPGIENALVLSNNAAGVPELYLRSARPLRTPVGDVEFRWLVGALTESAFFDTVSSNDVRSLSAAIVSLRLAADTGLTLGLARAVYAPVSSGGAVVGHAFDVFTRWNQSASTTAPAPANPSDQILSAFGRWVVPDVGFEFYGEWATLFAPGIRQLLVSPEAHEGYTVGFQWAHPTATGSVLRLHGEASMLEQTPSVKGQVIPIFYTSRFVPQGYTQRGQLLGAALGPGGSGQTLAADYVRPRWQAGVFVGRQRLEDEAMYLQPASSAGKHDASIYSGLRAALTYRGFDLAATVSVERRLDYLFQSDSPNPGGVPPANAIDVQNVYLGLSIGPRGAVIR